MKKLKNFILKEAKEIYERIVKNPVSTLGGVVLLVTLFLFWRGEIKAAELTTIITAVSTYMIFSKQKKSDQIPK